MAKSTYFQTCELLSVFRSRQYGVRLKDIQDEFGCSKRTAQRHVKFMVEQGWAEPTTPTGAGHKRWKATNDGETATPLVVGATEMMAQCLAIQAAAPMVAGTELSEALKTITEKIAAALPPKLRHFGVEAQVAFPPPPSAERIRLGQELLEDLLEATVSHRVLDVAYRPLSGGGTPKEYKMRPLAVFPHKGTLYVAAIGGAEASAKRPFYFAVHRFESVTLTKETFKPPKGFDAREFVQRSFGAFDGPVLDVLVRFSPDVAPLVRERKFHHTQTLTEHSDGSVDCRIQATGWPEVKAWILSYGEHAELLAPKDRRKEIVAELAVAARRYQS